MSKQATELVQKQGWMVTMRPRSPHEPHRPSTPLELFFDLVFVVAVLFPVMTLLILLTPFTGKAVLMTGLLLAALLTIKLISRYQGSYTQ